MPEFFDFSGQTPGKRKLFSETASYPVRPVVFGTNLNEVEPPSIDNQ